MRVPCSPLSGLTNWFVTPPWKKSRVQHTFTRQELYDLVWSTPIVTLAERFDISDPGRAKSETSPHPVAGLVAALRSANPDQHGEVSVPGVSVYERTENPRVGGSNPPLGTISLC